MNCLLELKHSDSWLNWLAINCNLNREVVDFAVDIFCNEAEITGDYELMPIRPLRNAFTGFLRQALRENNDLILYRAKSFYNAQNSEKQAYEAFKGILFGDNKYGRPMWGILRIPEQLTAKEFEALAAKIKSYGWDKFVNMLNTIESNEKYTAGQTNLNVLINKWLNF